MVRRNWLAGVAMMALAGCGYVGEANQVARQEVGPKALLKKYEWFKDAAAKLDATKANIEVQQVRIAGIEKRYEGVAPQEWHRSDVERLAVAEAELAGLKASFNGVASEYNSRMAKANYQFTNVGDLPHGESQVLPREFRTYLTK